jgi:hypothetical protein
MPGKDPTMNAAITDYSDATSRLQRFEQMRRDTTDSILRDHQ